MSLEGSKKGNERYRELHPDIQRETGRKCGLALLAEKRGLFGMSEEAKAAAQQLGGKEAGKIIGERYLSLPGFNRIRTLESCQRGQQNGGDKSRHIRWHVNRNIVKVDCNFCTELAA